MIFPGDFNIDILVDSKYCRELMDTLILFNLSLSSPLNVSRKTCLDHIYSDLTVYSNHILPSSFNDHYSAHVIYEKNISQASKQSMYRNYKNLFTNDSMAKYHSILMQELGTTDWDFNGLEDGW